MPAWAINIVWHGIDCHGNGTCSIVTNAPSGMFPQDTGIVTYEQECPDIARGPCVKIDFTAGPLPRTYFTRVVRPGSYLSFVRMQDGTYSDVNFLYS